jgi:hypothetical protein
MAEWRSAGQPAGRAKRLHAGCRPQPYRCGTDLRGWEHLEQCSIFGLVMHPKLPLLYMVGIKMLGVVAQTLDNSGDPVGKPNFVSVGADKYSVGISADAKYLYGGTSPDILEVISLDSDGNPTGVFSTYTVSKPACATKKNAGSGVSNFVTAIGFFPGYQYYTSPNTSYTNHLPQSWSIMAREIAMKPVIRQNLTRTVHIYNGRGPAGETLTEDNEYLTTCPVEALRVNVVGVGSPRAIVVVVKNTASTPNTTGKVVARC